MIKAILQSKNFKVFFTVLFLISIFTFFLTGCREENAEDVYSSTVEVSTIDINTEIAGRVEKVFVEEGSKIKKGDIIAKIDSSLYEIQKNIAQANLEVAKLSADIAEQNWELAKLKYQLLSKKPSKYQINQIKENILQLKDIKSGNENNIEFLEENIKSLEKMKMADLDTIKLLSELKMQLNSLKAQNSSLTHQINSLENQLEMVKNESVTDEDKMITEISVDIAKRNYLQALSYVNMAEQNLKIANLNLRKTTITSPVDGIVLTKGVDQGQFVGIGTFIAQIGLSDYYLKIYVPSAQLQKLSLGKKVEIILDSNKKAYGEIVFISDKGEFTPRNVETKEEKQKVVFMVKLKIIKNKDILRPGMLVDVKI
ncbi:biotin/lipoyl-binding protein [Caldicellulosiruptor changbaiensis]|uniref:Biotin/lipoyl-binding protein n=1 Tax=Caldicellulosiruptor changbaiensis TaxID=1222016 RepID=A0A3T0D4W5_9FIRM|nr:biotin/lipoyl-binding protein [Caldicellulosiruptor changbaiensis]AZT90090.1 biotin/lipoyl-binding protein [Caldicellulosiruptor changbaiensis]